VQGAESPAPADQQDKEVRQLKQQLVQQWKQQQMATKEEAARAAQEQWRLQQQQERQQRQQRQDLLKRQLQEAKAAKQVQLEVEASARQVRSLWSELTLSDCVSAIGLLRIGLTYSCQWTYIQPRSVVGLRSLQVRLPYPTTHMLNHACRIHAAGQANPIPS
jgi:hypothetical protein